MIKWNITANLFSIGFKERFPHYIFLVYELVSIQTWLVHSSDKIETIDASFLHVVFGAKAERSDWRVYKSGFYYRVQLCQCKYLLSHKNVCRKKTIIYRNTNPSVYEIIEREVFTRFFNTYHSNEKNYKNLHQRVMGMRVPFCSFTKKYRPPNYLRNTVWMFVMIQSRFCWYNGFFTLNT